MQAARLKKIGARRPTGAGMPPGRRAGLGGTRAAAHAARLQSVLPVHRQRTEAEDLSQEVFLRIYRTLTSYRPAYGAFPRGSPA